MHILDKILIAPVEEEDELCPHGLGYMFYESIKKYKNNIAQIDVLTGQKDTYSQLLQRSIRTAIELKSRGITRDDIITLNTNNHLNSSVPFIAAQFLGCRVASLDPSIPLDDAKYLLNQVNPRIIFTIASAAETIAKLVRDLPRKAEVIIFGTESFEAFVAPKKDEEKFEPLKVNQKETAVILFSSGTTGLPKGICGSHRMHANSGKRVLQSVTGQIVLAFSTLYWISAVNILTETCRRGKTRLLPFKFDPAECWNIIETYKASMLFCAPTQVIQMLKNKPKRRMQLNSLSMLLLGGGLVPSEYLNELRELCPHTSIIQGWGQTELGVVTLFQCTENHLELLKKHPSSCGVLMPGNTAKVVDPETSIILGPNEVGEIRIKSVYEMNGYHNRDSTDVWDDEGFICTGDVGYYNDDKCFFIVDRLKEMLKYQSWHVTPAKIEAILLKHPSVLEAVVIGKPDDVDGDHPLELVVLDSRSDITITPDDLRQYADKLLDDRHQLRGGVIFMNKLLFTSTGKFKRTEMRKQILNGVRKF